MRIRTILAAAATTSALAISAFAVPVAQATDGPGAARADAASRFGVTPKSPAGASARSAVAADEEPTIVSTSVHGGADIVLGTTDKKTISVAVTASHPSGIQDAYIDLWHGTDIDAEDGIDGALIPNEEVAKCTALNATTSKCVLTITVDPRYDLYKNALAGTWHVAVGVLSGDSSSFYWNDYQTTHRVQRFSKLTVNASPEPVKKGATITATGKLSRANWEDHKYHGYTVQPVALQFRKKDSSTYTTVKTIKTNSTGELKTTVTASTDGYWRWSFAGTSTTPAVKATGDFVDVQ